MDRTDELKRLKEENEKLKRTISEMYAEIADIRERNITRPYPSLPR